MNPGSRLRSSLASSASRSGILPSQPGVPLCPPAAPPAPQAPETDGGHGHETRDGVRRPVAVAGRPILLTHPTQLTAQRSPHHRPIVSRARTRFKHTRAYPGRARPLARHQSPLSRDLTPSRPRPFPTSLQPGSAPKAQAPPPGHDSEPGAGVSLARPQDAQAQSCGFHPALRPHTPTLRGRAAAALVFLARSLVRDRVADGGGRARRDKE